MSHISMECIPPTGLAVGQSNSTVRNSPLGFLQASAHSHPNDIVCHSAVLGLCSQALPIIHAPMLFPMIKTILSNQSVLGCVSRHTVHARNVHGSSLLPNKVEMFIFSKQGRHVVKMPSQTMYRRGLYKKIHINHKNNAFDTLRKKVLN